MMLTLYIQTKKDLLVELSLGEKMKILKRITSNKDLILNFGLVTGEIRIKRKILGILSVK